jgi:prevent-host-death family protein
MEPVLDREYMILMADVGVRELKARLSEYLARASRGEVIRITNRGKPTAILAPVPRRLRLDEGIAEGWVRTPSGAAQGPWKRFRASRTIADLLTEDRGV